jgi:hypothetical protein
MIELPKDLMEKQRVLQKVALTLKKGVNYSDTQMTTVIENARVNNTPLVKQELVRFGYVRKDGNGFWLLKDTLDKGEVDKLKEEQERFVVRKF